MTALNVVLYSSLICKLIWCCLKLSDTRMWIVWYGYSLCRNCSRPHSWTPMCLPKSLLTSSGIHQTADVNSSWQNLAKPSNTDFIHMFQIETKVCNWMLIILFGFADIGSERYTFGFTIRDSPAYFINVSSWGREEYIRSLSESFRVGDCGKLEFFS